MGPSVMSPHTTTDGVVTDTTTLESMLRKRRFNHVMKSANVGLARKMTSARTKLLHMSAEKRRFSEQLDVEEEYEIQAYPIKYFFLRMGPAKAFLLLTLGMLLGAYVCAVLMESCGITAPLPYTNSFAGKCRVIYKFATQKCNIATWHLAETITNHIPGFSGMDWSW